TIEGLAQDGELHPLQRAFHERHGLQCGYCTPGMIMAATAILERHPNPTDEEIRKGLEGNLCRCTGYQNIVESVKAAAGAEPGMLHLAFVRSQVAHGKLGKVDAAAALQVPGVVAVYTADDLEFQAGVPCGSNPTGDAVQPERWPLARGKVRHVGEPIAVVVAE